MTERLSLITARVDDMPVWLAQLERMGRQQWLDTHVATHGNGVGLSLGWVRVRWLTPSLSAADHRLNPVKPWAAQRLHTRRACTGPPVHPVAVSDDRRAGGLEALRDETRGGACEGARTPHVRRVDDLQPAGVRLDRPTATGHWPVTDDGLCPCGQSTAHRPDLPQVKVMVSALAPLGMPVATDLLPGQRTDDPVDGPAMTRVRAGLGRRGRLSVGDGTMGALDTRAFLQTGGDDDGCPLSATHVPPAVVVDYLAPVWTEAPVLTLIHRAPPGGPPALIAAGVERREPITAAIAGPPHRGRERRVVSRSVQRAQAAERGRRARLANAQAAVTARNARRRGQRRCPDPPALRAAVDAMLARARVQGRWHVRSTDRVWERPRRRAGDRDATVRLEWEGQVTVSVDQAAVAAAVRQLGWRVAGTTQPPAQLPRQAAVLAYRHASLVERARGRRNGRPVSLLPRSLARDDQATGVSRLLALGWRGLTLLECGVRRRVARATPTLDGV